MCKYIIILFLLIVPNSYAEITANNYLGINCHQENAKTVCKNHYRRMETLYTNDHSSFFEVAETENEVGHIILSRHHGTIIKIPIIFGTSAQEAINFSNNVDQLDNDHPCSNLHNHADFSNYWCHTGIANVVYQSLRDAGLSQILSHSGVMAMWAAWESSNINYDLDDVTTPEFKICNIEGNLFCDSFKFSFTLGGSFFSSIHIPF